MKIDVLITPFVGQTYCLQRPLTSLCCRGRLMPGANLLVRDQPTPNRLIVKTDVGGLHNVKRSSFRVAVTEFTL